MVNTLSSAPRENLELCDKLHFFLNPFSCSFVLCLNTSSLNWATHALKSTAISATKALAVAQAMEEVW